MKKIFSFVFAAMMLLVSSSAMAQSETLKGDVNADGVVDVADIAAIIKIMQEAGGAVEETKYYWYVGQSNPAEMTSIEPIVTDNTSPGWRYIGTSVPNYSQTNLLWNEEPIITGETKQTVYVAFPNNKIKQYLSDKVTIQSAFDQDNPTIHKIGGVEYYIYQTLGKMKTWSPIVY